MRQKQIKHTADFLDPPDKSCSLVLVNGLIPPGARKGDPIDIEVTLPAGTDTTSLKGGVLFECELFPYERAGKVRDQMVQAGADLKGAAVVKQGLNHGQVAIRHAYAGFDNSTKVIYAHGSLRRFNFTL